MAIKRNMTHEIIQAATEAAKMTITAFKEVENPVNATRSLQIMSRTGGPLQKYPTVDWKVTDTRNYETETDVKNIFTAKTYNMKDNKKCLKYTQQAWKRETTIHANLK